MELEAAVNALPRHWQAQYFDAVDSTQDEARAGQPPVDLRGQLSARRPRPPRPNMECHPGVGLLLTVVFVDTAPTPWRWTSLASVALAEAIEAILPALQPQIKWPNDLMLDGRKVAGILAETSWDGRQLRAIVGVGVNVSSTRD